MWNKAKIEALLLKSDKAVNRAIVVLYNRQTRDERAVSDTKHTNKIGFSAAHARRGSYYGRWCSSGRTLSGRHLVKARELVLHYTQQLADEANAREAQDLAIERSTIQGE